MTDLSQVEIAVVDDGELDSVFRVLQELGASPTRHPGGLPRELRPPADLLITSRKQALRLRERMEPLEQRPIWVVIHREDSMPLRKLLQESGADFLVHSRVHPEILRLMVLHALYQGGDRRLDNRVAVGSRVRWEIHGRAYDAILADLSLGGCRVSTDLNPEPGAPTALRLGEDLTGTEGALIPGVVLRVEPSLAPERHLVSIEFEGLPPGAREAIEGILNGTSLGSRVSRLRAPQRQPLDLEGDEIVLTKPSEQEEKPKPETEPEFEFVSDGEPEDDTPAASERRRARRAAFRQTISTLPDQEDLGVLVGVDLSATGMRIEPCEDLSLGDELRVCLYGSGREEPVLVHARVSQDYGSAGQALAFERLSPRDIAAIERMIERLPDIEGASGPRHFASVRSPDS